MRTSKEMTILRARIVQLRREGRSRRQIKEILGPMSNSTLDDALRGEPPPEWTQRHNPKTVRKNTGDEYHGCLRIDVRRSSGLYRRIEGWSAAIMSGG